MRKIVDGYLYDDEKAEEIAEHSAYYPGDFQHYSEKLYRTKKGNYFLSGSGGAASKYACREGNMSYGSSDIIPLDNSDTLSWLEKHDYVKEALELFGADVKEA